jgi:Bacterial Ig-like domain (group 3)
VGNLNNTGGKSLALQQLVNKVRSSTSVVSDNNPSGYGQLVTFTATVTCGVSPTKTVTFKYGGIVLGKALLSGNTATLSTSGLGAGTDAITGVYSGDSNCAGSTSPLLGQVVNIAATTESLSSSQNPSAVGQAVTLTATVSSSAGVPTGKVKFMTGAIGLGTVTLSGGVATVTTTTLPAGSDPITANYLGTTNCGTSSASPTQVVQ